VQRKLRRRDRRVGRRLTLRQRAIAETSSDPYASPQAIRYWAHRLDESRPTGSRVRAFARDPLDFSSVISYGHLRIWISVLLKGIPIGIVSPVIRKAGNFSTADQVTIHESLRVTSESDQRTRIRHFLKKRRTNEMTLARGSRKVWDFIRPVASLLLLFACCTLVVYPQSISHSLFQYAAMTGSGNTLSASRVPVVTASGTTLYLDIILQFDVDADGNLTISGGYPQIVPTPVLLASTFVAGRYTGPSTIMAGNTAIVVSSPGVSTGGSFQWSLSTASGADTCSYPSSATWYAGPAENSPVAARLKKINITSTAWSYGIAGAMPASVACGSMYNWNNPSGTLIGVSQAGNTLTIASFTRMGNDSATPVDQITYTLAP